MKRTVATFSVSILCLTLLAQQKDFEGILTYHVEAQSKSELISNKAIFNMLALGNVMTIMVKHGNYRQISGITDSYFITKDQRCYLRFKGVDTLYYVDYSDDTSEVTRVAESQEKRNMLGFECKVLTLQVGNIARKYYYSPSLYMNPEYDKNNRIGRYDVFAQKTSSLYLAVSDDNKAYTLSQTCVRVQPVDINDTVFDLPKLPQKKFVVEELIIPAEFPGNGGWEKYLQRNLDAQVASKYLKISRGEQTASQQVMVRFMINEYGRVATAEVVNKKDVNGRLADEALRVVNGSPPWKPATFLGEKIVYWLQVPITFEVTKQ